MASAKKVNSDETVTFDKNGKVVVNKESTAPKKLMARRAIEAHLERKVLEKDLESYYFE